MSFKRRIGFVLNSDGSENGAAQMPENEEKTASPYLEETPVPSVVLVYFEERDASYSYYNDRFDLHVGDRVFVEGKLANCRGTVTEVNRNFRIQLSKYMRVVAKIDMTVHGRLYCVGHYFFALDRNVIPAEKAYRWFLPTYEKEEYAVGTDGSGTEPIDKILAEKFSDLTLRRAVDYVNNDRVVYLSLDGEKGCAVIEGTETYQAEFTYKNGEVGHLVCDCYVTGPCKHCAAVLIELKHMLEVIREKYENEFSGYFAAVDGTFFTNNVLRRDGGSFVL